ncbi:hypothetical protein [Paenibacillus wynnii]|uniref:Uncharacterized protein n=1 Tax=Paenibacillus wynnii TaxID=268407 RepID=A0A098M5S9_9BACL|nr:hypothetical protein [Paenibacillus wynnii]KGE16907.1 hypothetical protein PWYN_19725 [Paenibacillus wynnii]
MEKNKLSNAGKDANGNDYLTYYNATFSSGVKGSINYGFKNGKLINVLFMFDDNSADFNAALGAYDQDKVYLEKVYNKGIAADDVLWYADKNVQKQYAKEFADDDYGLLETALTTGDLDLRATFKSALFSVSIDLTNLNSDEMDDPYYMHTISYVKN